VLAVLPRVVTPAAFLLALSLAGPSPAGAERSSLEAVLQTPSFCIQEGTAQSCLMRKRDAHVHVMATSGEAARILIAYPHGDTGAALFAKPLGAKSTTLRLLWPPRRAEQGFLELDVESSEPLQIELVLVGSLRFIRSYQTGRSLSFLERPIDEALKAFETLSPEERRLVAGQRIDFNEIRARARSLSSIASADPRRFSVDGHSLDGKHTYSLRVDLLEGRVERKDRVLSLVGARPLRFRLLLLPPFGGIGTEGPYPGFPQKDLYRPEAIAHLDRRLRDPSAETRRPELRTAVQSVAFLATTVKLLSGSWRHLTTSGWDTLLSLWLLAPALTPRVSEAGLQSVLDRLSPRGEVAGEESLGDQAALERLQAFVEGVASKNPKARKEGIRLLTPLSAPVYRYGRADADLLFAPALLSHFDDKTVSSLEARSFLAQRSALPGRPTNLTAVVRNLGHVLEVTARYAATGRAPDLIAIDPRATASDARVGPQDPGGGRITSLVNTCLVPLALRSIGKLLVHPKLGARAIADEARRLGIVRLAAPDAAEKIGDAQASWENAQGHFVVKLTPAEIRKRLRAFLASGPRDEAERRLLRGAEIGEKVTLADLLDGKKLPAILASTGLTFDGQSLSASGLPVEVLTSDDSWVLFGLEPPLDQLSRMLVKYELRYPVGLRDPFGIHASSSVYASRRNERSRLEPGRGQGTVLGSWRMGLLQLGLMKQLTRCRRINSDLARGLERRLLSLLDELEQTEGRAGQLRTSECFTVGLARGVFAPLPFIPKAPDEESNVIQLSADVLLAVDLERSRLGLARSALPQPTQNPPKAAPARNPPGK
jgi:hypothetical protein